MSYRFTCAAERRQSPKLVHLLGVLGVTVKGLETFAPHTLLPSYRATHDHFDPRPLSGPKRTFGRLVVMSAIDPKRTYSGPPGCNEDAILHTKR
jgi:hypothetical protein